MHGGVGQPPQVNGMVPLYPMPYRTPMRNTVELLSVS